MNEKVRSRVQAAEMGFLRRTSCLTLLDKVKSADIRESIIIDSLLLRLERSQLRWYGHVTRMSQEKTAKVLLCSTPIGQGLEAVPKLNGEITLKILVGLIWHPTRAFILCCKGSRCLEAPTRAAAPALLLPRKNNITKVRVEWIWYWYCIL